MPAKIFRDISASTAQVIINQLAGLAVFLLTSIYLSKEVYGELNWSVAILSFATTLLSLRLEQLLVRDTAAGREVSKAMTLFFLHTLFSGLVFWVFLYGCTRLFPDFFATHQLLLVMGISQLLSFFSSPFKQVANGKEQFGLLAIMSSVANFLRAAGLLSLILLNRLTVQTAVQVFIAGSAAELILCYYLVTRYLGIKLTRSIRFSDYSRMLKNSVPQIGAALLMAGITRMDWILLGFFSTSLLTAEYSFAYRVYELSPIPLLIIAPVLLSRFARFFSTQTEQELQQEEPRIRALIRIEMLMATFLPLVLNIIWSPLLDLVTKGKYGYSNATVFLILSVCTPFQYLVNILWTLHFTQNRLKLILGVTALSFFIICLGDLLAIPRYGTTGAAAVYLAAMIVEYLNYMRLNRLQVFRQSWLPLLICSGVAFISGMTAFYFSDHTALRLVIALVLYAAGVLVTGQLRKTDIHYLLPAPKKRQYQ